ncbi:MAG: helix-turn-helix domain-containing protein [Candidatus Binataceae bacterium]
MDTTLVQGRDDSAIVDGDSNLAEPYAIAKHIGSRVRTRRMRLGLSQQELADRIGLSWQQVQKYEHGVNRLAGSRLWDISCALECPVEWFFEGLQHESNGSNVEGIKNGDEQMPDEEAELLVRAYWAIDDSKIRNRFRALLDTISGVGGPDA